MMMAHTGWSKAYRRRSVLVTGATGFIGRWVAHSLSAAGAEVWLVARDEKKLVAVCDIFQIRGNYLVVDLARPGTFAELYGRVRPDVVFNLAGYGVLPLEQDEELAARLNADFVSELAETIASGPASDWPGLRLVHVGSAAEYGRAADRLTESTPTAPVNLYGLTKLEGTRAVARLCEREGLRAVTARLFTVYGPGEQATRLLPSLVAAARSGDMLSLTSGTQRRDFTYVGDVAEGLVRLGALLQASPIINLSTGRLSSVREFVECAAALLGLSDSQLRFGALPARPDELHQGPANVSLLRHHLGWVPQRSIADGIQHTIDFERRFSGVEK